MLILTLNLHREGIHYACFNLVLLAAIFSTDEDWCVQGLQTEAGRVCLQ